MAKTIVVVEHFDSNFGVEEKRVFKSFANIDAFENYCLENNIRILKGGFGTRYYDDTHGYIINHVEFFE